MTIRMQSGATWLVSSYDEKDVMLYALGVGFMRDPLSADELPFAYENNGLKVVPSFASVIPRGEAPPENQRIAPEIQHQFNDVCGVRTAHRIHKAPGRRAPS